ncbi:hypothetical protein [Kribbella sp. NPDC048928]|uniref:hypothetical protein n=1 Tax=Kribbella sp. NPDC048928 TaxID=3364111 RepID=UPI003719E15A
MTQTRVPYGEVVELSAVRVKMGAGRTAPQPDPLGRALIGYAADLAPAELWERGRGVWKAKVAAIAESDLAILAVDGQVVMVGTVNGVTFHEDRVAISGRPLPTHPLIGGPDPLHNDSRNPIAYGLVRTMPASAFPEQVARQRDGGEVMADAVRVLTEAARRRRPVYRPAEGGGVEQDPDATEPADWAEFVAQALVAAAANVGGIETALSGRSGSWEADHVRQLVLGTVGAEEEYLWEHRTEPLTITVYVDDILTDRTDAGSEYLDAEDEIERRRDAADEAARAAFDDSAYLWYYDRGPGGEGGEWIPRDPAAPAWSWDAWRAELVRDQVDPELIEKVEESLRTGVGLFSGEAGEVNTTYLTKSPEAAAALRRQEDEDTARDARYDALLQRLEQQQRREWIDYGQALKAHIEAAVPRALSGLTVPVEVVLDSNAPSGTDTGRGLGWTVEDRLIEAAIEATSSPADLPGTPLERLENRVTQQEDGGQ